MRAMSQPSIKSDSQPPGGPPILRSKTARGTHKLTGSTDLRPVRSGGLFGREYASVGGLVRLLSTVITSPFQGAAGEPDERSVEQRRYDALINTQRQVARFVNADAESVARELGVDPEQGLSSEDAAQRLLQHGPNKMDEQPPKPLWKLFLDQFNDILVMLLIAAAIVSMALGEYIAGGFVIVIVIGNAVLGCVQEYKAGNELDALSDMSKGRAMVLRNGEQQMVEAETLVPGDVVVLETGAVVPADIRLTTAAGLQSLEASLTGEPNGVKKSAAWVGHALYDETRDRISEVKTASPNVKRRKESTASVNQTGHGGAAAADAQEEAKDGKNKKREKEDLTFKNMVYLGCTIHDGRGTGIVVKTGMATQMGEINALILTADKKASPLEQKLAVLGKKLGLASILISLVVFVIGVTTERGADPNSDQPVWLQMLLVTVSLVVAAVPEGLPAAVTVTLAIGMKEMARRNALIRTLPSVETLGSASVICTDKTGTLTAGVMTLRRIWFRGALFNVTGGGYDPVGKIYPANAPGVAMDEDGNTNAESVQAAHDKAIGGVHEVPLFLSCACSNATLHKDPEHEGRWIAEGNMSERPLVVAAAKVGIKYEEVRVAFPRIHENTFSSQRKMMSTFVSCGDNPMGSVFAGAKFATIVKGAPNVVIERCSQQLVSKNGDVCPLSDADRADVLQAIDDLSDQSFRVLCIAYKPEKECPDFQSMEPQDAVELMEGKQEGQESCGLIFAGLVASIDPERPGVAPSIAKAAQAGIRVVMITGDFVKTARAIAINIGLLPPNATPDMAIDCRLIREIGTEMESLAHDLEMENGNRRKSKNRKSKTQSPNAKLVRMRQLETKLDEITCRADVYARAKPVDKITIVRSLQRQGNVCSMTGDGVNDAPALKQADIGVAMGISGTDVAKGAADMVLVDDKFETIVDAIEQGRTIYANITKFVYYLLSTNISEVFLILFATGFFGLQSPLLPLQILWLNLVTDGAPAIALAIERTEPGIMTEGPRLLTEPMIEKVMITGICIQTVFLTGLTLGAYIIALDWNTGSWDGDPARTAVVTDAYVDEGIRKARTTVILLIVFAELLRAYGSRSLRQSVFKMGVFSNSFMQWSVISAMVLTVVCTHVPGPMDVFDVEYIDGREYALICCFAIIPILVDELTKWVYRCIGFGARPRVRRGVKGGAAVSAAAVPVDAGELDTLISDAKDADRV